MGRCARPTMTPLLRRPRRLTGVCHLGWEVRGMCGVVHRLTDDERQLLLAERGGEGHLIRTQIQIQILQVVDY